MDSRMVFYFTLNLLFRIMYCIWKHIPWKIYPWYYMKMLFMLAVKQQQWAMGCVEKWKENENTRNISRILCFFLLFNGIAIFYGRGSPARIRIKVIIIEEVLCCNDEQREKIRWQFFSWSRKSHTVKVNGDRK